MVINSRFRDYYDKIRAFGRDPSIVYNRKTSGVKDFKLPKLYLSSAKDLGSLRVGGKIVLLDESSFLIGFCGKIYPGIRVAVRPGPDELPIKEKFVYSLESWLGLLDGNKIRYNKYGRQSYQEFFDPHEMVPAG